MDAQKRFVILAVALVGAVVLCYGLSTSQQVTEPRCIDSVCPRLPPPTVDFVARYGSPWPDDLQGSAISLLPPEWREHNYAGGSCGHASMATLFRSCNMPEWANWWRSNFSGGTSMRIVCANLERLGLRYAYTDTGDMEFLERCAATGRGAVVRYKPSHLINFVTLNDEFVFVLDNNSTQYPERHGDWEKIPRAEFERNWKSRYTGTAWTLLYTPITVPKTGG